MVDAKPSKLDRHKDRDYHAECEADDGPVPTVEEVRAILSKIPGSLPTDISAEREDRL